MLNWQIVYIRIPPKRKRFATLPRDNICDTFSTNTDRRYSLLSTKSTQPCIPPGSLNRVSASAGGKGGIHTSVGWQVTLCDPIWHVSFPLRS